MEIKKSRLYIYLIVINLILIVNIILYFTNVTFNSYLEFTKNFKIQFNATFFWIYFCLSMAFNLLCLYLLVIITKNSKLSKLSKYLFESSSFIITLLSIIFLIFGNLFIFGRVDGNSMLPTLENNQRVVISHYRPTIKKGDIAIKIGRASCRERV